MSNIKKGDKVIVTTGRDKGKKGEVLKIFPKEFYCQDCHFTWTNVPEHPRYRFWNRFFSGPASEG